MTCNHEKSKVYAVREFKDGSKHYCIQCLRCLRAVKKEGQKGHWLSISEIPPGYNIRKWKDGQD